MAGSASAFETFNRWLLFFGLILFGAFLLYRYGLLGALLEQDQSRLSLAILALFIVASLRAGLQAHRIGHETRAAQELAQRARAPAPLFRREKSEVKVDSERGDASVAHEHLAFLAEKALIQGEVGSPDLLLERLDQRLRRGHETGWFLSDLMIRLGLLGTVIGFILMLGSITNIESIDLQALQQLLGNMSSGMRVALYTTLTGLGCGMLLGMQHQLLDQGADRLLADIIELSEVHAAAQLQQFVTPEERTV